MKLLAPRNMFKFEVGNRSRISKKNLVNADKRQKNNLIKTSIFTIGILASLNLVSCGKKDDTSPRISNSSPSISQNENKNEFETKSKLKQTLLCESNNNLVASFETKQYLIHICRQGNQSFFIRQQKSASEQLIRLPAVWNQKTRAFSANSGNTIYAINGTGLMVWQDGNQILADPIINDSSSKSTFLEYLNWQEIYKFIGDNIGKILKAIAAGIPISALYIFSKPYIHKLGSNGRAIAYVVSIVAWPGITVACLAIAEIPLGLLAPLAGALALGFSFGAKQVVENAATVALNLRDDVYEVDDIIGFSGDDDFYQVNAIKTSSVKLLSVGANAGRILNISPSVLAQKEFVNYTQNGSGTLCKWTFPISLKAQVAQPGKGDINRMEDALLRAAKEVQAWIIHNTKHPEAKASFAAQATKDSGRQDIPAGVFLTKVEKFIHHYVIALWVPGIEMYRVSSISNELLHHAWYYVVEHHNLELATLNTVDDTDIVEATQAIAKSLREGLGKVHDLNETEYVKATT
ncbi:small-conductance mechanosensitive channel [Rivularia sp. PCC 7116]|uniref:mechanosensitive ion channel domain-containing protein n=1 Tax=Rivularia sp. PCC 7116 TaxID=373994 RepID=UPI00029F1DE4|nr:mechanosensitive ion channel domain-containing protein [Rivularia sp. PCC 7116]AFY55542.1 small-conductance mechanosensitive channel [Rivularia sp. PCC 7116]